MDLIHHSRLNPKFSEAKIYFKLSTKENGNHIFLETASITNNRSSNLKSLRIYRIPDTFGPWKKNKSFSVWLMKS